MTMVTQARQRQADGVLPFDAGFPSCCERCTGFGCAAHAERAPVSTVGSALFCTISHLLIIPCALCLCILVVGVAEIALKLLRQPQLHDGFHDLSTFCVFQPPPDFFPYDCN